MMSDSDSWQTPDDLFQELDKEFDFSIDLCATEDNAKLERYYKDYLNNSFYKREYPDMAFMGYNRNIEYNSKIYASLTCFMNPPYSNPRPFIEKAWEDSKYCKIVCLVPNTIKTCKYMDILDANKGESIFRDWLPGLEIRDFSRRTGFNHPEKIASSPSFGCMLLIMDRRGL